MTQVVVAGILGFVVGFAAAAAIIGLAITVPNSLWDLRRHLGPSNRPSNGQGAHR